MKRAPSTRDAAAVALGDRAHDREPEAGALAAARRAAPETLERVRGLAAAARPGAFVGDADPRAVAVAGSS